jgi:murein DD-endopeptidase MepM/ murein hydrolase activator NlpD
MTKRLIVIFAALAALAVGFPPNAAHAITSSQAKDDLSRNKLALQRARQKIDAAKAKQATLDEQIRGMDDNLGLIEADLADLNARVAAAEQELASARERLDEVRADLRLKREELAAAETRLAFQEEAFEQRVVLTYKTNDLSYLDVLLASTSFEDLVSRLHVVKDLIGSDNDLVGQLQATRNQVEAERDAIAQKEEEAAKVAGDLELKRSELAALKAAKEAKRHEVLQARAAKHDTLEAVEHDLAKLRREEDDLLAQSRKLTAIINGSSDSGHGSGTLIWPCGSRSAVTSLFGWRIHPILHTRRFHTGIDIGVAYGTRIAAADGGAVIYATWMSGYGNTTIIDHGGGLSTLYAHQSSYAVSYGETVTKGELIGYVGSTGLSTGPHLHFEVRVNGSPVDPLGYLP